MTEIKSLIEEAVSFARKYSVFSTPLEPRESIREFWAEETMHTAFTYDCWVYVVEQIWNRTLYHTHYTCTIYRDGEETDLDISFVFDIYDRICLEELRSKNWRPYREEN